MKNGNVCFVNNNLPLNWNGGFSDNMLSDVTLVFSDGKMLNADKLMLCLNSPYFDNIIKSAPSNDGLIFMEGFCYFSVQSLLEVFYTGQTDIRKENVENITLSCK